MKILTPEIAQHFLSELRVSSVEEFWALALSPNKSVIESKMIFRGTVDACLVHPRDIFRFACVSNASSIIVAHNHPSGDAKPSTEDILVTRQLVRAARLLEIPLLDHLILTKTDCSSMAREGWCRFPSGFYRAPRDPLGAGTTNNPREDGVRSKTSTLITRPLLST